MKGLIGLQLLRKCIISEAHSTSTSQVKLGCYLKRYGNLALYHQYSSYSTVNDRCLGTNQVKELLIPNEFGNIAAKAWGKETGHPILALHGWLDNCGTFDNLFPLLSDNLYIVAIDEPGHGMSTHKPPGCFYTDISMIMDFKKVIDFLGWEKFSIIGHSLGGSLSLMFASIFPSIVHKLVILDIVKPSSRDVHLFPGETINAVTGHLEIEKKLSKPSPVYTEELAVKRLYEGMFHEVTLEGIKVLNKRGTRPSECGKGVVFTRDLRARTIEAFSRRSHDFVLQFMSAVHCEMLMIMANHTHPNYATATPEVIDSFYDIYRKNTKNFVLQYVDGNHFVHLNNPERIAPMINNFLSKV